jgi:hypothetical protein
MKHRILLMALLVGGVTLHAQTSLPEFNQQRFRINQTGFLVLSSWSAANIVSGIVGQASSGGQSKYFHQMNLIWGSVNLLIALPGYLAARKGNSRLSLEGSVKGQGGTEKTFIFNAGLDLAYLAGGAWFLEKANNSSNPDKYRGYGKSILLQGGFLLLFDAIMFSSHNQHGKKLYKLLGSVQAGPGSLGFNIGI